LAGPARAALITIAIEATVDYVRDEGNYLEGRINVGDIITGTYTYESTTADSSASQSIGRYMHYTTPCGIRLTVGGLVFQTDPEKVYFGVEIMNDEPWANPDINRDVYAIGSENNLPFSNGTWGGYIHWQLDDPTGNAVSSTDLPTTAPILDRWEFNELDLDGRRDYLVRGHVTSAIVIPEPATILLLSVGVLALRKRQH